MCFGPLLQVYGSSVSMRLLYQTQLDWYMPAKMRRGNSVQLTIRPLSPDLWPALEDLFNNNGACKIGAAYRKRPCDHNQEVFRQVVKRGPPPD